MISIQSSSPKSELPDICNFPAGAFVPIPTLPSPLTASIPAALVFSTNNPKSLLEVPALILAPNDWPEVVLASILKPYWFALPPITNFPVVGLVTLIPTLPLLLIVNGWVDWDWLYT